MKNKSSALVGIVASVILGSLSYSDQVLAVECDDGLGDYLVVENPAALNQAIGLNGCGEYIVAASDPDDRSTFHQQLVLVRDIDVLISGGWDPSTLDDDDLTQSPSPTILDGILVPGMVIEAALDGPRRTVILDNLTIQDSGGISHIFDKAGGGLHVEGPVDVYLRNVDIRGNVAAFGGGISLTQGAVLHIYSDANPPAFAEITRTFGNGNSTRPARTSRIQSNRAEFGGAIFCDTGGGVDLHSQLEISRNRAEVSGGGIYADRCSVMNAEGIYLADNEAAGGDGGGIYVSLSAELRATRARAVQNKARLHGGAIFLYGGSAYLGGRFDVNTAVTGDGGAIRCVGSLEAPASLTLGRSELINNRAAVAGGGLMASECDVAHAQDDAGFTITVADNRVNADFSDPSFATHANQHAGGGLFIRDGSMTLGSVAQRVAVVIEDNHVSQQRLGSAYRDVVINPDPGSTSELMSAGGGIEVQRATLQLANFSLKGNRASLGAAVNLTVRGTANLEDGEIVESHATGLDFSRYSLVNAPCRGGRAAVAASDLRFVQSQRQTVRLERVSMRRNFAHLCGSDNNNHAGALLLSNANAEINNSEIYDAGSDGGIRPINLRRNADLTMTHVTVVHASQPAAGSIIHAQSGRNKALDLTNSVFHIEGQPLISGRDVFVAADASCIAYSGTLGGSGLENSTDNLSLERFFSTAFSGSPFVNLTAGNLRLRSDSSLRDQCDLAGPLRSGFAKDVAGAPRPVDTGRSAEGRLFDPGAHEEQTGVAIGGNSAVAFGAPIPDTLSALGTTFAVRVTHVGEPAPLEQLVIDGSEHGTTLTYLGPAGNTPDQWQCNAPGATTLRCVSTELLASGTDQQLMIQALPPAAVEAASLTLRLSMDIAEFTVEDNVLTTTFPVVDRPQDRPDFLFEDSFE
ncbi:MAG: hypothetical protein AAGA23_12245 [Pseudomonadota bacterium]